MTSELFLRGSKFFLDFGCDRDPDRELVIPLFI